MIKFKSYVICMVAMLFVNLAIGQSADDMYKLFLKGKNTEALDGINKLAGADATNLSNQLALYNLLNATGNNSAASKVLDGIKAIGGSGAFVQVANIISRLDNGENVEALQSDIDKALRKGKKQKGVLSRAIGEYLLFGKNKNTGQAFKFIKAAVDEYSLDDYTTRMLLGQAYLAKRDAGNAVTNFEYAAEKDKTSPVPHYLIGTTYIGAKNYEFGVPGLRKAIELDPDYSPAQKELGKYYFDIGQYAEAKEIYSKYIAQLKQPEIIDKVNYGNILFFNKDYKEALEVFKDIRKTDQSRSYIDRLMGWAYYETGDYPKALEKINYFFSHRDTTPIIADDYSYLGRTQTKLGEDSLSYISYLKAFSMDSTQAPLIKEIGDTLFVHKNYTKAAMMYYAIASKTNLAVDYFYATRADYLGENYMRGDSAAQGIINKLPEEVTGYLWRARHNVQLDTAQVKTGAANTFYEKVLELGAKDVEKYKKELSEAANYLTVYYINKEPQDLDMAQKYNDLGLEYDPFNEQTNNLLTFLAQALEERDKKKK